MGIDSLESLPGVLKLHCCFSSGQAPLECGSLGGVHKGFLVARALKAVRKKVVTVMFQAYPSIFRAISSPPDFFLVLFMYVCSSFSVMASVVVHTAVIFTPHL
jgi:hypothetical protein